MLGTQRLSNAQSAAAVEFSNLLKQSKVLHLNPNQPVAITSSGGYLHRNEFGLKRPLPPSVKRSPFVKVRALDKSVALTRIGQTDFESSAASSLFVKRWDESGRKIDTRARSRGVALESSPLVPRDADGEHDAVATDMSIGQTQATPLDAPTSRETQQQGSTPDFVSMNDHQFQEYLNQLRQLQPAFKELVASRQAEAKANQDAKQSPAEQRAAAAKASSAQASDIKLWEQVSFETEEALSSHVLKFLKDPAAQKAYEAVAVHDSPAHEIEHELQAQDHPLAALNYSVAAPFDTAHFPTTVPARLVKENRPDPTRREYYSRVEKEKALNVSSTDAFSASTLGLIAGVDRKDAQIAVPGQFNVTLKLAPPAFALRLDPSTAPADDTYGSLINDGFHDKANIASATFPHKPKTGQEHQKKPVWRFQDVLASMPSADSWKTTSTSSDARGKALVPELFLSFHESKRNDNLSGVRLGSTSWAVNQKPSNAEPRLNIGALYGNSIKAELEDADHLREVARSNEQYMYQRKPKSMKKKGSMARKKAF